MTRSRRHLAIVQDPSGTSGRTPAGGALMAGLSASGAAADRSATHRTIAVGGAPLDSVGAIDAATEEESLQVGELAKLTGKTVRAIHLYESMGLLRPVERTRGRFRLFNRDSVERVRWIGKLQAVGFSLPEIQEIVRGQESAGNAVEAASRLRGVYLERLSGVQTKLAELHRLERELLSSLTYLDACQSACDSDAPTESCPSCGKHLDQPEQPALVSGLHVN